MSTQNPRDAAQLMDPPFTISQPRRNSLETRERLDTPVSARQRRDLGISGIAKRALIHRNKARPLVALPTKNKSHPTTRSPRPTTINPPSLKILMNLQGHIEPKMRRKTLANIRQTTATRGSPLHPCLPSIPAL